MLCLARRRKAAIQEGVKKFHLFLDSHVQYQKHYANDADELQYNVHLKRKLTEKSMNVNDSKTTDEDGFLSNNMMIRAKNIMKERIWINRVINETTFETHCEATKRPSVHKCHDCCVHTCGPHGTCVDGVNSHSCYCDPGFQEIEVDRVKLDFIHTTNAQNLSYSLKVNEFTALTTSESVSRCSLHKHNDVCPTMCGVT